MPLETKHLLRSLPIVFLVAALGLWLATRGGTSPNGTGSEGDRSSGGLSSGGLSSGKEGSPQKRRAREQRIATHVATSDELGYVGSASCRPCHRTIHDQWKESHHGLAEVPYSADEHASAFEPARQISHANQKSVARTADGVAELVTEGPGNEVRPFVAQRIIGLDPLWQPLVEGPRGRLQATDVFGEENRRPEEWGHWSNRGMTWNSMCASCHTTDFQKNYDIETDSYESKFVELSVGCESCHGPYGKHVEEMHAAGKASEIDARGDAKISWPPKAFLDALEKNALEKNPGPKDELPRGRLDVVVDSCGACHARRSELTARFVPGERFLDHFRPIVPDTTEIYYPDGQVREEDYEYVSFLSSRMYRMGVRCVHCHEPHTSKIRAPGNELCLGCHQGKIDPAKHSHHDLSNAGSQCTGCHMPLTTYMQRDPRHDHGFTIPDPLLTQEFGIPNACDRCHEDKSTEWAIRYVDEWYGERMDRHTRKRARTIARARRGDPLAVDGLLGLLKPDAHEDQSPLWRSIAAGFLGPWVAVREDVREAVLAGLSDADPLVRATCARVVEPLILPEAAPPAIVQRARAALLPLLDDPVRLTRVEAAWALRRELDLSTRAARDLRRYLDVNSDQPTGALQQSVFHFDRREQDPKNLEKAEAWITKAVSWDRFSAPLYDNLATIQNVAGRKAEAVATLEEARKLEPEQPFWAYRLGLALADAERHDEALRSFEKAVELDDQYARAWYNLALARSQKTDTDGALEALRMAIGVEPRNAHFFFTRATILQTAERYREALDDIRKAEELSPPSPDLIQYRATLLQALGDAEGVLRAQEDLRRLIRQ